MSRSEDGSDILHGILDRQLVDDFLAEKGLNLDLDLWNNFTLIYSLNSGILNARVFL